ncbi:TPA_asm: hypothetical protein G2720_24355 [Salmonella enterica subsp. enterica serovar Enteritidis str. P125109]|uniref:Uncharacterized protein n=1 Tax=Salmonella enteritidis PT4 (strain P125109) TaxID=550537 RepID=A0A724WLC2_SALEP|nr:hypothetical protein [Salmonella enterica subsp. enterica serovar Enteritidis str. P125109]
MNNFIVTLLSAFLVLYFSISLGTIIKFSKNNIAFEGVALKFFAFLALPFLIIFLFISGARKIKNYSYLKLIKLAIAHYPIHVAMISTKLLLEVTKSTNKTASSKDKQNSNATSVDDWTKQKREKERQRIREEFIQRQEDIHLNKELVALSNMVKVESRLSTTLLRKHVHLKESKEKVTVH